MQAERDRMRKDNRRLRRELDAARRTLVLKEDYLDKVQQMLLQRLAELEEVHDTIKAQNLALERLNAELCEAKEEAELLARIDPLTGVYNRRAFTECGNEELHRTARFGYPLSLLMIDVDQFKFINDIYGHGVGDQVISSVAQTLKEGARDIDTVGRLGGDEFAIILPDADWNRAELVAERLRHTIERLSVQAAAGPVTFTASFGVACLGNGHTLESLLEAADRALYCAKTAGRNRVAVDGRIEL